MLLKFALQEFYEDREYKNLALKTIEGYKDVLGQFNSYCIENKVLDVREILPKKSKFILLGVASLRTTLLPQIPNLEG